MADRQLVMAPEVIFNESCCLSILLAVENGLGEATLVTSVALAVGNKELSARETLSFGMGGVPISKIIDPALAFDFLFSGFAPAGDSAGQAAAKRRNALGQSVIDYRFLFAGRDGTVPWDGTEEDAEAIVKSAAVGVVESLALDPHEDDDWRDSFEGRT